MIRLPNGQQAIVDSRKLTAYCLNPAHPRGRHKARVFREVLGVEQGDSAWLQELLLNAAIYNEATMLGTDEFGDRWQIDITATRHTRSAVIRSIWIVLAGDDRPRFVTCWVI